MDPRATPSTPPAASPPPGEPTVVEDWPHQATVQIVKVVDTVRDKTTGPIISAARAGVYGLVAVAAAVVLLVLLTIGLIRGLTTLLDRAWLVYLLVGGLYCAVGVLLWTRRQPQPHPAEAVGNNADAPQVP